jgi:predicted transcriptional regulator
MTFCTSRPERDPSQHDVFYVEKHIATTCSFTLTYEDVRCPSSKHLEAAMTGISLNLPEDLSNSLADLAKTNGQSASYLAMDVLRDYIEHEKTLIAQIELAVKEADQGKFASQEQVAAMRARRWSRNAD